MRHKILVGVVLLTGYFNAFTQQRIGIGTDSPVRTLDVAGSLNQHIRVRSTTVVEGLSGLELVRGTNGFTSTDWRIVNDDGVFKIQYTDDNFNTAGSEAMRIIGIGNTGIGTSDPVSVLHIDSGTQVHNNDGYLTIGNTTNNVLSLDNNSILSRLNGAVSNLYIQSNGGTTYFGHGGGDAFMAQGGGNVGIGSTATDAPLSIDDGGFQLYLRNQAGGSINDWYIGASNDTWIAGDNQLLFSPTSSSSDAVLRLMNVSENDGSNAPVMIHTNADHTILLDGNEIDTRGTPLYINHNTENDTYINPSGGKVAIGTTSPDATLHIVSTPSLNVLAMQRNDWKWALDVYSGGTQNMAFISEGVLCAQVSGVNGQWLAVSDARLKERIDPMPSILQDVLSLPVFSYTFTHDPDHTPSIGIMAQDLLPRFPDLVKEYEGQYGVAYAQLAVLALKAIQEQQVLIDTLRQKVETVKVVASQIHKQPISPSIIRN